MDTGGGPSPALGVVGPLPVSLQNHPCPRLPRLPPALPCSGKQAPRAEGSLAVEAKDRERRSC